MTDINKYDSKVKYVVKYPHISTAIIKDESGIFHHYNPNEIYAKSWSEAHNFLRVKAMEGIMKANEELNRAIRHLDEVMQMTDPEKE